MVLLCYKKNQLVSVYVLKSCTAGYDPYEAYLGGFKVRTAITLTASVFFKGKFALFTCQTEKSTDWQGLVVYLHASEPLTTCTCHSSQYNYVYHTCHTWYASDTKLHFI